MVFFFHLLDVFPNIFLERFQNEIPTYRFCFIVPESVLNLTFRFCLRCKSAPIWTTVLLFPVSFGRSFVRPPKAKFQYILRRKAGVINYFGYLYVGRLHLFEMSLVDGKYLGLLLSFAPLPRNQRRSSSNEVAFYLIQPWNSFQLREYHTESSHSVCGFFGTRPVLPTKFAKRSLRFRDQWLTFLN